MVEGRIRPLAPCGTARVDAQVALALDSSISLIPEMLTESEPYDAA
jgi:hypothetical protein